MFGKRLEDAFDCRRGLGGNPQAFLANGRIAQVRIGVGKLVFHAGIVSAGWGWLEHERHSQPLAETEPARPRPGAASGGDDLNTSGETELMKQLLAIGPGQPESAHVGHAEARHDGRNGGGILFRELAFHQGVFGPIHPLRLRDVVAQVGRNLVRNGLFGDDHKAAFKLSE